MQVELDRCIETTRRALATLSAFSQLPSTSHPNAHATVVLRAIASSGIPIIEDSRIPSALSIKLHELTETFFGKACMGLLETHAHRDVASLQSLALQLKTAYTTLYERKLVQAANARSKAGVPQKQPFANDILMYAFEQSPTPTRRERERLASLTGMTLEQVRVWFQNRRSRSKKKAPELQSRPPIALQELLERVVTSNQTAKASKQDSAQSCDCDDDNDSGYCSDQPPFTTPAPLSAPLARDVVSLSTFQPTARSYPAVYVPTSQPTPTQFTRPSWRRTGSKPPTPSSTVTVDELCRSMSHLSLRQRRGPSRATTGSTCSVATTDGTAPAPPSVAHNQPKKAKKAARKESEAVRKVAGGRRAASANSCAPMPRPAVSTAPLTSSPSSLSPPPPPPPPPRPMASYPDAPVKGRKKAGPPRRRPTGKALSCLPPGILLEPTRSCSSDSSRSTSCASDFSFTSRSSDDSFTSVESVEFMSGHASGRPQVAPEACFDINTQQPEPAWHVPVYDFSTIFDQPTTTTAPGVSVLVDDPMTLQLLRDVQVQCSSDQRPELAVPSMPVETDQHLFDVGLADMDVLLDLSSTSYPTLEYLLNDGVAPQSPLPDPHSPYGSLPSIDASAPQSRSFWGDWGRLVQRVA